MGPDKISVIQVVRLPPTDNSPSSRLYRKLIELDTEFSSSKSTGSIQLHFNEGSLTKLKTERFY